MQFVGTFWALVPPIIAITLALITKEAYSSLFIGVVIGALFACDFAPVATIDTKRFSRLARSRSSSSCRFSRTVSSTTVRVIGSMRASSATTGAVAVAVAAITTGSPRALRISGMSR